MNLQHGPFQFRPGFARAVGALAVVVTVLAARPAGGQEKLLWGGLRPGPHAVGYRALYQLDYTRQYDPEYATDAAAPRPILICVWYPARPTKAEPIAYRRYLEVPSEDPRVAPFAKRLMPFVREVVCEESIGKKPAEITPAEAAAFERLLAAKTFAVPAAAPAAGRFPVVVYHPGLGGTHEDNSALFEYLASHGYVVLSSAYPSARAALVNIDWDLARSFRDMEFLSRYAAGLPFADADCLAAVGHSYGAQAALAWCAEPGSAVRAVVSLDSTVENVGIDHPGFARLKAHFQDRRLNLRAHVLRFASRENKPRFAALEPYLKFAPRYEATVGSLDHNDYLTHGAIRPALMPENWPDAKRARAVRASYDRVCEHALRFLDAALKQRADARELLQRSLRGDGLDEEFTMRFRPPAPAPPTARQLALVLRSDGARKAAELLQACRDDVDVIDVLGGLRMTVIDFRGQVVVDGGQLKEALALFKLAADVFPKSAAVQHYIGAACEAADDRKGAVAAYRRAMELVPGETAEAQERAKRLKELEERLKKLGEPERPPARRTK